MLSELCILLTATSITLSQQFPKKFKKCDPKDDAFEKCLMGAVDNALEQLDEPIAEVGLPSLEPFIVDYMRVPPIPPKLNFTETYNKLRYKGIRNGTCKKFRLDLVKKTVDFVFYIPDLHCDFEYDYKGEVFFEPIFGKGLGYIDLNGLNYTLTGRFESYTENGKTYIKIEEANCKLPLERFHIWVDNLFDGNTLKRDKILNLLDKNWKEFYDTVVPTFNPMLAGLFIENFNRFFSKVPVTEVFGTNT